MFEPTVNSPAETISLALAWLRDLTIFGFVLLAGWKSRDLWQDVKDFTTTIRAHMKKMERFAYVVEHNHMKHMQQYLFQIAKDRNIITVLPEQTIEEITDPVEPPEDEDASR